MCAAPGHRNWCPFPKMKCICSPSAGYKRLESESHKPERKDYVTEKEGELQFFNDDGSCHTFVVERSLPTSDLCDLLALKNRVGRSYEWCVLEFLVNLGLERIVEDHENVLTCYRDIRLYDKQANFKFIFRKDYRKYEFFHSIQQFFPLEMIDLDGEDPKGFGFYRLLEQRVVEEGRCPVIFSPVWIRNLKTKCWVKSYLLLKDKTLYRSDEVDPPAKFGRSPKSKETKILSPPRPSSPIASSSSSASGVGSSGGVPGSSVPITEDLSVLANLSDYYVYSTLNAKNQFRAPTEWGLCLRPITLKAEPSTEDQGPTTVAGAATTGGTLFEDEGKVEGRHDDSNVGAVGGGGGGGGGDSKSRGEKSPGKGKGGKTSKSSKSSKKSSGSSSSSGGVAASAGSDQQLHCIACESERARTCWLTAMRLAKYGKQLRENYKAFKNKQAESMNPKDYNSYTVPNESVRSRVAMDFTGSVGRIVEDPKEAKAIALAEGYSWKRRWRPSTRANVNTLQGLDSGVHVAQPWFHSGMSRDQASSLVGKHGTVDGVFLVRDSRSNPGSFVLTYKWGSKVLHAQINPVLDPVRESHVFTLDNGVTKFYDLLQLVEFYQLNAGSLPTRLTHYVVQSTSPISAPNNNEGSPPATQPGGS